MDLIQPYYLAILFEAHTPYMLFYIDLLRNDALMSLEIALTVPIPLLVRQSLIMRTLLKLLTI